MIISRYLTREVFTTLLATTISLVLILLSNQVIKILEDAAIGRFTTMAVFQLLSIQIPVIMGYILPVGLFVAILFSYGRLYADNEMTILSASGISPTQLLMITLRYAFVVFVVVCALIFWAQPKLALYREQVIAEAAAASPIEKITPGRFESIGSNRILYVQNVDRDLMEVQQIFVAQLPKNNEEPWNIVVADSARQEYDSEAYSNYLVFDHGYRYIVKPGDLNYQIVKFDQYAFRIDEGSKNPKIKEQNKPTSVLWEERHSNVKAAAELQWRAAVPISTLILALLALPLSKVNPRQGKFARLLPAIILYMVYMNLMFVSHQWTRDGTIPMYLGIWWVHALMLIVAIGLWSWRK